MNDPRNFYEWLKNEIESNPDATQFTMTKPSACTLAFALGKDFKKLGEILTITKSVLVKVDAKRLYFDTPQKAGDLMNHHYESEPMDMAVLMGQEVQ